MVKEAGRKELTQCQHCWKSRLELPKGATLSRCAGCQTAFYCSKECQKAAGPVHKTVCRLNSATRVALDDPCKTDSLKKLQAFCSKDRPAFARLGIYAFELNVDLTRCMREVIYVQVAPNPYWDGKKAETAFLAFNVEVVPVLEFFGDEKGEEMLTQLKTFHEEQRRVGRESGFMVVFSDAISRVGNVCGVGFGQDMRRNLGVEPQWKEKLMHVLNTGKVF